MSEADLAGGVILHGRAATADAAFGVRGICRNNRQADRARAADSDVTKRQRVLAVLNATKARLETKHHD
jgi:hypothetical protein